ncbi:hypothetical protein J0A68_08675 [Algoriphagus sp. H41]|uniref:Uncharacterized protein n=1 Tax=Algoriphagus oliviformis TaxID=2811231 RepID=A0ABS3C1N4_9BACT|nr:hypothetical protein [Algoriphagus oliviformis]MBN7811027.1 hypothetical protein [Algoriphagus oliviformis]
MREVTVQIPEEKLTFFLELMDELGLSHDLVTNVPKNQQELVLERIKKSNPNDDVAMDTFFDELDGKLRRKTV